MSRREQIESMLADSPDDIFLQYSLAMELDKEGEHDDSLRRMRELQAGDPPHVPSFFMAAQQLGRLGRTEEARAALRDGIEVAREQGNKHAASEMADYLAMLGS